MKKRLFFIISFVLIGLIIIDIYFKNNKNINYYDMDYQIYYNENINNPLEYLTEINYVTYYFEHYDPDSYIEFANNDKISIKDALNKGYIFIKDLEKKINIKKTCEFTLEFNLNNNQELAHKYYSDNLNIYYYKINDIQLIKDNNKNNLLELLESNKINKNTFNIYLEENFIKEEENNYIIYKKDNIVIYIKDDNIYIGNNLLNINMIEKS